MICQKCGRESVVLLRGWCGDCHASTEKPDYPSIWDCEHGQLRRTCERCEDAKRIAALVALNEQKDAEIARLRAVGIDPDEWHRRLAAAYERGARDALRWEQLSVRGGNPAHKSAADVAGDTVLARFLASRGTA